ncbi:hypothetical protein [Scytonema sp. PRP1]|uniref:hypothetical protein n=1 Tax=Scytonema sp. PRP1 TaxID=3120513 RepID=UPI00300D7B88
MNETKLAGLLTLPRCDLTLKSLEIFLLISTILLSGIGVSRDITHGNIIAATYKNLAAVLEERLIAGNGLS